MLYLSGSLWLFAHYRQPAFDVGLDEQTSWFLANGKSFESVAGIHVFGAHFSPGLILRAPLALILGGLVAADRPMSERTGVLLAVALGALHGQMNGVEMAAAGLGLTGLSGTVAMLFVCVSLVTGLVVSLRPTWTRVAVRVAGSWIVAVGLLYLGWTLGGRG